MEASANLGVIGQRVNGKLSQTLRMFNEPEKVITAFTIQLSLLSKQLRPTQLSAIFIFG
jgi:hypothetical protein